MVVFCAGIAAIILGSMKSSWACSEGLALAWHNAKVVEKLGEPIETGWFVTGSIEVAGPSGTANLAVPIHGPHNSGTLYVVAHKAADQWQFDRAEVEVNSDEKRIDLLTK
ncbi:MAG TPA: cytochrome c oxidase assembly factor Coa1 family protein [Pirellulales bacterium]|nr:cytochrome c oxidase assembly factor Coa1 family protein [Pirellulales bacterium]